jgi:hypothetical protein
MLSDFVDSLLSFLSFFWSVFAFWALWQVCDFLLARIKVKLRKPWVVEVHREQGPPQSRQQQDDQDESAAGQPPTSWHVTAGSSHTAA